MTLLVLRRRTQNQLLVFIRRELIVRCVHLRQKGRCRHRPTFQIKSTSSILVMIIRVWHMPTLSDNPSVKSSEAISSSSFHRLLLHFLLLLLGMKLYCCILSSPKTPLGNVNFLNNDPRRLPNGMECFGSFFLSLAHGATTTVSATTGHPIIVLRQTLSHTLTWLLLCVSKKAKKHDRI